MLLLHNPRGRIRLALSGRFRFLIYETDLTAFLPHPVAFPVLTCSATLFDQLLPLVFALLHQPCSLSSRITLSLFPSETPVILDLNCDLSLECNYWLLAPLYCSL